MDNTFEAGMAAISQLAAFVQEHRGRGAGGDASDHIRAARVPESELLTPEERADLYRLNKAFGRHTEPAKAGVWDLARIRSARAARAAGISDALNAADDKEQFEEIQMLAMSLIQRGDQDREVFILAKWALEQAKALSGGVNSPPDSTRGSENPQRAARAPGRKAGEWSLKDLMALRRSARAGR